MLSESFEYLFEGFVLWKSLVFIEAGFDELVKGQLLGLFFEDLAADFLSYYYIFLSLGEPTNLAVIVDQIRKNIGSSRFPGRLKHAFW